MSLLESLRKYNIWDKEKLPEGFKRKHYLNCIVKYLNNNLVKVIIGQRRSGKSYFLRQIINYLVNDFGVNHKNIFYFNKEYIDFESIKTDQDLNLLFQKYKETIKPKGKIYIFLDEIQNVKNWETFVNSYSQDFTAEYEIFITGSNSKLLSSELSTLLSGRYVEFIVFPFSYQEYFEFYKMQKNKQSLLEYLQTSGLPELVHLQKNETKQHYIEGLKNTIILRDIISRYRLKDSKLLDDIFKFLSTNLGNLTSANSLVKYFKSLGKKTNYETVSDYISYLTETFIFHEVERYNIKGKTVLLGIKKLYINDLGFKNYIFGFNPTDLNGHLENFVFLQLFQAGYKIYVGKINDFEIDFIAEKSGQRIYLQVAYLLSETKTIDREIGNLLKIKDNYPKFIVTLDDLQFSDYQGVRHLQAWNLDEIIQ